MSYLLASLMLLIGAAAPETMDLEGAPIWLVVFDYAWKIVIPLVFAYFAKKYKDNEAKKAAFLAIETAVDQTYLTYVKKAKEDGDFQSGAARNMAVELAKNVASKAGKKVLNAWGKDALTSLVHRVANRKKKENK